MTVQAHYGEKTLSSEIDILTDPEPAVVNVKHVGPTFISVWWPAVPGTLEYQVQLFDISWNLLNQETLLPSSILQWAQPSLRPATPYIIKVTAVQESKQFENVLSVMTSPVPEMPLVSVSEVFSTQVGLTWNRPDEWDIENQPHIISPMFLELEYSREGSEPIIVVIPKNESSYHVTQLEPNWNYSFAMVNIIVSIESNSRISAGNLSFRLF